jgi:hypothetical protein
MGIWWIGLRIGCGWNGSGACPITCFDISGVETYVFVARLLVFCLAVFER